MKHKHNATDLFPTWYKSIDPVIDAATVTNRITAINNILEDDSRDTWFTIVKIAFGMGGVDRTTVSGLETEFKDADINFPLISNENILHVLAQIALCFLFESEHTSAEQVAMAVSNTVFSGNFEKSGIPFYEYAREWLSQPIQLEDKEIETDHKAVIDALESMEEAETEVLMDYTDQVALLKTVDHLYQSNNQMRQESNILWWLFGQFSSTQQKFFAEVGVEKMILTASIELAELNISKKNMPSAKHLLHRALLISNENKSLTKKFKLSAIINSTPANTKAFILSKVSNISEFTPCLLAISLSNQFEEEAVWKGALKSKIPKSNLDAELMPTDIAFQIYCEIMFLSSLGD